jgi:hypothetical protein
VILGTLKMPVTKLSIHLLKYADDQV